MAEPVRHELTRLYTLLVDAFAAGKDDLALAVLGCGRLAVDIARSLSTRVDWDEELLHRARSVIVLLDHVGAPTEASHLLRACQSSADGDAARAFGNLGMVLDTRHGEFDAETPRAPDVGAIARFAVTASVFDDAIYAARLADARTALHDLAQLAALIMSELGEDHPYLGMVLLTLSSAKCALAAVDGNVQDMRRYADVLAIAVQRASVQLGPDHPRTISGLANLAHVEFEIALASRSPHEVAQCLGNLDWLAGHSERLCGPDHPTVITLEMNAAVAALESARQGRSLDGIQRSAERLRKVARRAEERFGLYHPCAAIARSNSAAAGFDLARAERSIPGLTRMVGVLEDTVSQVSNSLGAGHATARALTRQLHACRRLLAGDSPWTDGPGSGTDTIVRTIEDEMWGLDDDYVPVYDASEDFLAAIDRTIRYFDDGDTVEGTVVRVGRREVLVEIGYKFDGIIPDGELSYEPGVVPSDVVSVGDAIEVVVLRKEDAEGRLLLSKKRADLARGWAMLERARENDELVTGTVLHPVPGGLMIDVGVQAFLPASQVAKYEVRDLWPYVGHVLQVKVVELDRTRDRVVVSRRAWLERLRSMGMVRGYLREGQIHGAVVRSLTDSAAVVDLEGVTGVVDLAELSWMPIDHPSEVVYTGQPITVVVLDVERDHVSLSLRATHGDPWQRFADDHAVGEFVRGTVSSIEPFGAYIHLDGGIEGLLHLSEMAVRRGTPPGEAVRLGESLMVRVLDIDLARRRITLSLRQPTTPEPPPPLDEPSLTRHEAEIVRLVAEGRSNAAICRTLHINERSLNSRLSRIYTKLGLRDRGALRRYAVEHDLTDGR